MVKMRRRTRAIQVHPCAAGLVGSLQKALGGPPDDPVIETHVLQRDIGPSPFRLRAVCIQYEKSAS